MFAESLKAKGEDVYLIKKDLRLKDETIQQREIEISCLRGQVNSLQKFCDETLHPEPEIERILEMIDDDSDTLTAVGEEEEEDEVLLQDLEWDETGTLSLSGVFHHSRLILQIYLLSRSKI